MWLSPMFKKTTKVKLPCIFLSFTAVVNKERLIVIQSDLRILASTRRKTMWTEQRKAEALVPINADWRPSTKHPIFHCLSKTVIFEIKALAWGVLWGAASRSNVAAATFLAMFAWHCQLATLCNRDTLHCFPETLFKGRFKLQALNYTWMSTGGFEITLEEGKLHH